MPLAKGPRVHKSDLHEAIALATVLLAYSNGTALWAQRRGIPPDGLFRTINPFLAVLMLAYAAVRPGGLANVGLRRTGLGRSLAGGLGVGLALSAVPLFLLQKPLLLDTPLEYGPVTRFTRRRFRSSNANGSRCRSISRRAVRWRCWRNGFRSQRRMHSGRRAPSH